MGKGRETFPAFCRACNIALLTDEGDYCQRCYGELPRAQQMADDAVLFFLAWVEGLPPASQVEVIE
jgi:hypothetical protein